VSDQYVGSADESLRQNHPVPVQFPRVDRAARTSLPSRILSSQEGQTRGVSRPSGVNTRTYRLVTKELQFWHSGIVY